MLVTLTCAAMTVIFFIISQVSDSDALYMLDYLGGNSYHTAAIKVCICVSLSPGERGPLALGRAHSAGEQRLLHRHLWHVEPVRLCHHVPLRTLSQTLRRRADKWSVHHW